MKIKGIGYFTSLTDPEHRPFFRRIDDDTYNPRPVLVEHDLSTLKRRDPRGRSSVKHDEEEVVSKSSTANELEVIQFKLTLPDEARRIANEQWASLLHVSF
jgi:hypothetical protein